MFAATALDTMFQEVGHRSGWPRSIAKEFLQRHPREPLFRIRTRPGEAHIAPTENLAHDGCTALNPYCDISFHASFHALGDFGCR